MVNKLRPALGVAGACLVAFIFVCPPQSARAQAVTVSGTASSLDISISEPLPCREAVTALASAIGVEAVGDCGDEPVIPNRLRGVSLHAALSTFIPHRPFAIRLAGTPPLPAAIIFPAASGGPNTVAPFQAVAPPVSAIPVLPVPEDKRDDFVNSLPMLKTH